MAKTLVAYYSWTGHTREVAEAIAAGLGADLEEICEVRRRSGWLAYLVSAWEALQNKAVPIKVLEKDASAYGLVVIGTPVWAGRMSSPVRAYVGQERHKFARIALFCTEGGANGEKALAQLAQACGKEPAAMLVVTEKDLKSGAFRAKVADFTKALN